METPAPFTYAIEISHDQQSLDDARKIAADYFKRRPVQHEVALEQRSRLVVKFTNELDARAFYFSVNGRFVGLPSNPFELRKGG